MFRIPCTPPYMLHYGTNSSLATTRRQSSTATTASVLSTSTVEEGTNGITTSADYAADFYHQQSVEDDYSHDWGGNLYAIGLADNSSGSGNRSEDLFATVTPSLSVPEIVEDFLLTRVIPVICALGIAGNLLNLAVLTHYRWRCAGTMERLERTAHAWLAVLATSDLLFCMTLLPHAFVDRTNADFTWVSFDLVYAVYRNGAINVFTMTSTWLTVSMAITRYLAVCHPLRARSVLGMSVTRMAIVVVFVVSCLFNIPRFLVESIADMECAEGYLIYFRFPRIRSRAWLDAYGWLYFAVCIALPLVVLVFCNAHLIHALRVASRQRQQLTLVDRRSSEKTRVLTLTLVVIVIMYVAFVVPAEFAHFVQTRVRRHWQIKPYVNMLVAVFNTMQAMTFSVNFLLYCLINSHFRRNFRDLFFHCCSGRHQHGRSTTGAYELVTMTTSIAVAVRDCKRTVSGGRSLPEQPQQLHVHVPCRMERSAVDI